MSENQYADILDDDTIESTEAQAEAQSPKALREYAKEQKRAREAAEAELNKLRAELRQGEVKSKLAAAGLPEGAAKFAASAEDLDAWINENRGLFGGAGSTETQDVDPTAPVGQPSLSPEQVQRMQATNVQPGAFNPGGIKELDTQVNNAQSREELLAILAQQGRLAR
jgi:hypothetical protein